jgi:hypothetical protein
LDAALCEVLFGVKVDRSGSLWGVWSMEATGRPDLEGVPESVFDKLPLYTASLDAALALCERVLPGESWGLQNNDRGQRLEPHHKFWAAIGLYEPGGKYQGSGATPAIALLAALLKALISQEQSHA